MARMDIPVIQHNLFNTKADRAILCHCLTGPWGLHINSKIEGTKAWVSKKPENICPSNCLILSMAKLFLISRLRQSFQVHKRLQIDSHATALANAMIYAKNRVSEKNMFWTLPTV